jgi:hypothetical protein
VSNKVSASEMDTLFTDEHDARVVSIIDEDPIIECGDWNLRTGRGVRVEIDLMEHSSLVSQLASSVGANVDIEVDSPTSREFSASNSR